MNRACGEMKGTKREVGKFTITLTGYSKETKSPCFMIVDKRESKHGKYEVRRGETWKVIETKVREILPLESFETDMPDLNLHFHCEENLNGTVKELFDLLDQFLISELAETLGDRSYKLYGKLANPSIEVIDFIGEEIITIPKPDAYHSYWIDWMRMVWETSEHRHAKAAWYYEKVTGNTLDEA